MERNARAHFRVVRVDRWLLAAMLVVVLSLLLLPTGKKQPVSGSSAARVQPGVRLGNRDFSGMTEEQAKSALRQMAPRFDVPAQPAREWAATGAGYSYVIPELNGYVMDVDATWYTLVTAKPGVEVAPVTKVQTPGDRLSNYPQSVIKQGNASKPAIGLMINVDWGKDELAAMLPILDKHGAKVTIFVSGKFADGNREIISKAAAKGHEVASHGYNLATGPLALAKAGKLKADIAKSVNSIESITGSKVLYWAPHMNELSQEILTIAGDLKLRTVLSSLDPADWDVKRSPQVILQKLKQAKAGDLILLHPRPNTVAVLDEALTYYTGKGLKPLTLSDLLSPEPTAAER